MEVTWPSHGKLCSKFTAMGPYFRKEHSSSELYFFDCLASCISAKPAADKREFYGWWFELRVNQERFEYHYWFGLYDKQGEWQEDKIPKTFQAEVEESLNTFYPKLLDTLQTLGLEINAAPSLSPNLALPAA